MTQNKMGGVEFGRCLGYQYPATTQHTFLVGDFRDWFRSSFIRGDDLFWPISIQLV